MRRWFPLAAALALATACITEKEFRCDESVGHLLDCCPEFDRKSISCDEDNAAIHNGGGGPDISISAAHCLLGKSCDDIRKADTCTKLEKRNLFSTVPDASVVEISCAQ
jgi:hypothetical protein